MDPVTLESIMSVLKLGTTIFDQFVKASEEKKTKIKALIKEVDNAFKTGDTSSITSAFDAINRM